MAKARGLRPREKLMNKDRRALNGNRIYNEAPTGNELQPDGIDRDSLQVPGMVAARLGYLTRRELEVLQLLAEGLSNKEIARSLVITTHTVKAHITRILYKLGVESRTEAAVLWATRGVMDDRR